MNSHVQLTMDKESFLRWAERQEGRYELKNGVVAMMAGGSRNHSRVTMRLAKAVMVRIDPDRWDVHATDLAIEIDGDIRYPDVMVETANSEGAALSTSEPTMIVEVLSPSSIATDLYVKAAEYMSLASLEAYIVAAQDEPRLWIWNRSTEPGRAWPKAPLEVHGRDQAVPVPSLGVELPMAEIYAALPQ